MTWNHRVVRRTYRRLPEHKDEEDEVLYEIHEVFYNMRGEIEMITKCGVDPVGDDVGELRETLHLMLRACDAPVLDYDTHKEL